MGEGGREGEGESNKERGDSRNNSLYECLIESNTL
jgi:hypothetical protein